MPNLGPLSRFSLWLFWQQHWSPMLTGAEGVLPTHDHPRNQHVQPHVVPFYAEAHFASCCFLWQTHPLTSAAASAIANVRHHHDILFLSFAAELNSDSDGERVGERDVGRMEVCVVHRHAARDWRTLWFSKEITLMFFFSARLTRPNGSRSTSWASWKVAKTKRRVRVS